MPICRQYLPMKFSCRLPALVSACAASLVLSFQNSGAVASDVRCELSRSGGAARQSNPLAFVPGDGGSEAPAATQSGKVYFVSPRGNDTWSGRQSDAVADGTDGPFATIERARDAVRADQGRLTGSQSATIYLRGGRYELKQPLVLTAKDAGTRFLAFRDEHPELSGARSVRVIADRKSTRLNSSH